MSAVVVWFFSVVACVVVVLTRVRLGASGAGTRKVSASALTAHTAAGAVAAVAWFVYVGTGHLVVGLVSLVLWWVTALAGAALTLRWLPTRGRHVDDAAEDNWANGGWLSQLAHGGLLVAVVVLSVGYAFGIV